MSVRSEELLPQIWTTRELRRCATTLHTPDLSRRCTLLAFGPAFVETKIVPSGAVQIAPGASLSERLASGISSLFTSSDAPVRRTSDACLVPPRLPPLLDEQASARPETAIERPARPSRSRCESPLVGHVPMRASAAFARVQSPRLNEESAALTFTLHSAFEVGHCSRRNSRRCFAQARSQVPLLPVSGDVLGSKAGAVYVG